MKKSKHGSAYLRFLALCHALDYQTMGKASHSSVRLLEEIALAEFKSAPYSVTQVMALVQVASPATIHRKLQDLITSGMVQVKFLDGNRRTKFIFLTDSGHKYFDKRGALLAKTQLA